ncbi:MAG: endonuclease/exonuclease/phosphatase family protein [Planctomycetota bacterium]
MMRTRPATGWAIALTAVLGALAGCGPAGARSDGPNGRTQQTPAAGAPVVIDGSVDEWTELLEARADSETIALRFSSPVPGEALQAASRTTTIAIDLDDDPTTGRRIAGAGGGAGDSTMGAEVLVELSPANEDRPSRPGRGARVTIIDAGGARTIDHTESGLIFLPTYAADAYELRLDRAALPESTGRARARVISAGRGVTGGGAVFQVPVRSGPVFPSAMVPDRAAGGLRVMSHNVLRSSPRREPDAFARLYKALKPDVLLVQEWDGADEAELIEWFEEHVGDGPWHAASDAARGVSIVSRHPVVTRVGMGEGGGQMRQSGGERPPRATLAVVRTPVGDVLVGSLHLKCCGGAGTAEDQRRIREAEAVHATIEALFETRAGSSIAHVVLGGDLNLVGTRTPLDVLRTGVDLDDSELAVAPTPTLGRRDWATWHGRAGGSFTPGRLDYLVWSDASSDASASFALDTEALPPSELSRLGLTGEETSASDHLPLVLDLVD